jgi:hypothetical protein
MTNYQTSHKNIADLEASKDFKARAQRMGLHCLQDVLNQDIQQLKAHNQFNYIWYTDLLNLLKQEGLLDEYQNKLL